jgi:hypothetical protein
MPGVPNQPTLKCYSDRGTYIEAAVAALALVSVTVHIQNVLVILKDVKLVEAIAASSEDFEFISTWVEAKSARRIHTQL